MKTSLKLFLTALLLTSYLSLNAQDITLGVKGGFNASHMIGDTKGSVIQPGFHLGVTVDCKVGGNFYLMSGLELTSKGGSEKNVSGTRLTAKPVYIQMPIHAGTKFSISDKLKLTVHGGPYIAYGISGEYKIKGTSGLSGSWDVFGNNTDYTTSILTNNRNLPILSKDVLENPELRPDPANQIVNLDSPFAIGLESAWVNTKSVIANSGQQLLKRFDMGVGIGLRLEIEKFNINIGYEISAINAAKQTEFKHEFTEKELNGLVEQYGEVFNEQVESARSMGSVVVYKTPNYAIRNGNLYIGIGVRF